MPRSQRPRKPRGVPQHRRDLQRMDKPVPAPVARTLSRNSKLGLAAAGAAATVGGVAALGQTPRGKARRTLYQNRNNPQFKEALTHQVGVNMAARQLRAAGLDVKVRGEVDKAYSQDGTNVRRVTPRHPSGRFVSHTNDLMVIHPRFSTDGRRAPRDSKLQVWGKGKDKASRTFVGKAAPTALTESLLASGARRGQRLG